MLKWCVFATILLAFVKIWLPTLPWIAVFTPILAILTYMGVVAFIALVCVVIVAIVAIASK